MKQIFLLPLVILIMAFQAQAYTFLSDDLDSLVFQGQALQQELSAIQFDAEASSCSQLGTLNTSIEDYIQVVQAVSAQITSPFDLTEDELTSVNDLSDIAASMSTDVQRLSGELQSIEDVAELFEYKSAMAAMLRLSDDIGTMADRILEMADRILVMADNIGMMADRILETQRIQNTNIVYIQNAMLTTQQNMLNMANSVSTITYNFSLGLLIDETDDLRDDMELVSLTSENAAEKLDLISVKAAYVLTKTTALITLMNQNSEGAAHYIDGNTLTMLGDLSGIHKALSIALQSYANSINQIAPLTETPILSDATVAMLKLTKDIGLMSNRIMEMVDKIIIMADNIGEMSGRIVETQALQEANMVMTQNNLLASQEMTINAIKTWLP